MKRGLRDYRGLRPTEDLFRGPSDTDSPNKTGQPIKPHWTKKYVNGAECCNVVYARLRLSDVG